MKGTEKQIKWANDIIDKAILFIKEQGQAKAEREKGYENSIINHVKIDTEILEMMRDKLSAKQIIDARFALLDELEPVEEFCKHYNIEYGRASRVKYTDAAGEPKKYWGRLDSEPSGDTDKEISIISTSIFNYINNALNT